MWILRATVDERTRTLRLLPGMGRTLGRGPHADFVVDDALLSRIHCRLTATEESLAIEDLKSTNGTFVNEARVSFSTLENGDRVRVGQVEFSVIRENPAAPIRWAASARSSRSGSRRPGG